VFSFHKSAGQAKKKKTIERDFEFKWRGIYTWLLVIVPIFGGVSYLVQNHTFLPIKTIQLLGIFKHIDQKEIGTVLSPFVGEGFFSLDIQKVRHILSEKAWADSVSIRRLWPDRVMIQIVEKKPLARWDDNHLLSDEAQIFEANVNGFGSLPKIYGANVSPKQVLQKYDHFSEQFIEVDETIKEITIDSRGAVDINLVSGLRLKIGRDDVDSKIERLISIYTQQIRPRRKEIQQLDLRYSNGFAIAWKKEALINKSEVSMWENSNV